MADAQNNECPSCASKGAIQPVVPHGTPPGTIPAQALAILRANAAKPEVKARFAAGMAEQARAEAAVYAQRTVPVPHEPSLPMSRPITVASPGRLTVSPPAEGRAPSYLSLSRSAAIEAVGRPTYMRDMTQPTDNISDSATVAALHSWPVFGGVALDVVQQAKGPVSEWAAALKELAAAAEAAAKAAKGGSEKAKKDANKALADAQKKEAEKRANKDRFLAKLKKKKCCPKRVVCKVTYVHGLEEDYGLAWKAALLDVFAEWEDAPSPCDCGCCVYRQYVKGYHTNAQGVKFGKDSETPLASGVRLKETYQEDGGKLRDGTWVKWGYDKFPGLAAAEVHEPCSIKLRDTVYMNLADHGAYLTISLRIVAGPGCENAGEIVMEEEVEIKMPEGEETPGTRVTLATRPSDGPPANWPAEDARDCG